MALTQCRECGRQVSTESRACPHCGAPYPHQKDWQGTGFEWKSRSTLLGYPLVHVAFGRTALGERRVAKGVVAIGTYAVGAIVVAHCGLAIVFGLGQFILGPVVVAQFAFGILFGAGQVATGWIAIGQMALGYYVLAQAGMGRHPWTSSITDPAAREFFLWLRSRFMAVPGGQS
jgi:hypothetical protein